MHPWPEMTIGHLMGAIFAVADMETARDFKKSYIEWQTAHHNDAGPQKYTPSQIVELNIGWCFGDDMDPERIKMWSALGASHPIFGMTQPTPEQAFEMGVAAGQKAAVQP